MLCRIKNFACTLSKIPPRSLKKKPGAGMFIHGPGWEGFKYIKSFMLEVCTVYIPFSILYTVKLLRNVKAEEFLITNDKIKSTFLFVLLFWFKTKKIDSSFLNLSLNANSIVVESDKSLYNDLKRHKYEMSFLFL